MKKILTILCICLLHISVFSQEYKSQDLKDYFFKIRTAIESNKEDFDAEKKKVYIEVSQQKENNSLAEWGNSYYKALSKLNDMMTNEADFYIETVDLYSKDFNSLKELEIKYVAVFQNLCAKDDLGFQSNLYFAENAKKKGTGLNPQMKTLISIANLACLSEIYLRFITAYFVIKKNYSEKFQTLYRSDGSNKFEIRYEKEKELEDIMKKFNNYLDVKALMLEKTNKVFEEK